MARWSWVKEGRFKLEGKLVSIGFFKISFQKHALPDVPVPDEMRTWVISFASSRIRRGGIREVSPPRYLPASVKLNFLIIYLPRTRKQSD
jgi:hypothetical protein